MDPLQQLWDLYEEMRGVPKPPLTEPEESGMGTPTGNYEDHPVINDRKKVDALRLQGMSPEEAHQMVYGDLDTSDVDAKGKFASTLGRVQDDNGKKGIKIDKDAEFKSLLAKDDELEKQVQQTTPADMATPIDKQVPDKLQQPDDRVALTQQEEVDYNDDVAYLQKYGRA